MKYLLITTILYLLLTLSKAWSLPTCPESPLELYEFDRQATSSWNNCIGELKIGVDSLNESGNLSWSGEWKNGHLIKGTFLVLNEYWDAFGAKYKGDFKDGSFHGQGTYTYADGSFIKGLWKYGSFRQGFGKQQNFMMDLIAVTSIKNYEAINSASETPADNEAVLKSRYIKIVKQNHIDANNKMCDSVEFDVKGLKENWYGEIKSIEMDDDGKIDIEIYIGLDYDLREYNTNSVLNWDIDKSLYDKVLKLRKGDKVKFSGTFYLGNRLNNECLYRGEEMEPGDFFIFKFSNVETITP